MLNENIILINGINSLFEINEIILDKTIVNVLYVTAIVGFLDATIIPTITGKYELINKPDVFKPTAASVRILLKDSIINDRIINIEI